MSTLIIDIETVGENFEAMDPTTQAVLTRYLDKESLSEEGYAKAVESLKNELVFSPLTGQIVAIGVLDADKGQGVVYFQDPTGQAEEVEEGNMTYKPMTEEAMLRKFWQGAIKYSNFVTFNGRTFDIPYIIIRSAIHKIKATKDLMSNRYLSSQRYGAVHIDLFDQLSFYGAVRRPGGLHLWCRAFGITSPKAEGVDGGDVATMYQAGQYLDIARYNGRDLFATRDLHTYWQQYIRSGP